MSDALDTEIVFLSFEQVCLIHDEALAKYGQGESGFLDENVVRSAAGQSQAALFGMYFHDFPAGMAAAYLYFLTRQQGFRNGNKRTAVACALAFLELNGYELQATPWEVYKITVELAGEDVKRDRKLVLKDLANWITDHLVTAT